MIFPIYTDGNPEFMCGNGYQRRDGCGRNIKLHHAKFMDKGSLGRDFAFNITD